MTWRNDGHGLLFSSGELKLFRPSHTWAMKLSQLGVSQHGIVRVMTYSFPAVDYVERQFGRRPSGIWVLGHARFLDTAHHIKRAFPSIRVAVAADMHSKVVLISPATLYIGSANFGHSGWHETVIGIRSAAAHDWFAREFALLWQRATEVQHAEAA